MTEVTASKPPPHRPDDPDPDHPLYGFLTNHWFEMPKPNGPEWFSYEERCRREAHANAYGQHGDKVKWKRYLNLGFFTFEDCAECDKVWDKMDTDPLMVHRSIWYNFMYHVDHELKVPAKLNAWATNVTHPYLAFYDPTTLNETDTDECTWKEMPFMTAMEEDTEKTSEWIPVLRRRRSTSPPSNSLLDMPDSNPVIDILTPDAAGLNTPPEVDNSRSNLPSADHTQIAAIASLFRKKKKHKKWSSKPPSVSTVTEGDEAEDGDEGNLHNSHSSTTTAKTGNKNDSENTSAATKPPTHRNIPMNDGTHRITIRWSSDGDTKVYESDKSKLYIDILALLQKMFTSESGSMHLWEEENQSAGTPVLSLTDAEVRDFISQDITFLHTQSKVIFGIRFGFSGSPGKWLRSEHAKTILQTRKVEVTVSNSPSTSGKMVVAGYILLKAPNTTHVNRYTQYLRSLLPDTTPYFDIRKYKKTPMDQLIPHLVIQCGDNHVTKLCQALINILTGRSSALFLPRYAFSTLDNEQVRQQFLFHQKWSESLVPLKLSPHVTHLDQLRVEFDENGNSNSRSTREWAQSMTAPDGITPALYDVVNGLPDQQAYLLVPRHLLTQAEIHLRDYKTKLQPPNQREAKYRENLPGLPDVIHIRTEIQSNVTFLAQMSSAEVWKQAPSAIRQVTSPPPHVHQSNAQPKSAPAVVPMRTQWPTVSESAQSKRLEASLPKHDGKLLTKQAIHGSDMSRLADDDSTTSTQSLTQGSQTVMSTRFQELELMMKAQQKALDESGKTSTERLLALEQKFHRIDDLDRKLTTVTSNLEQATTRMEHAAITQHHMSNDVKDMKSNTAQQFGEINQRLISTMENQHQMSSTMIDLRSHFEKMSTFMLDLASKLEAVLQAPTETSHPYMDPSVAAAPSSQNSSVTSASSHSHSTDSSTSSTVYRSPEQKKQRASSETKPTDTHEDFADDILLPDVFAQRGKSTHDSTAPRVNLENLFKRQETASPSSSLARAATPRLSNVSGASKPQVTTHPPAPLNSQYNPKDSDGAQHK